MSPEHRTGAADDEEWVDETGAGAAAGDGAPPSTPDADEETVAITPDDPDRTTAVDPDQLGPTVAVHPDDLAAGPDHEPEEAAAAEPAGDVPTTAVPAVEQGEGAAEEDGEPVAPAEPAPAAVDAPASGPEPDTEPAPRAERPSADHEEPAAVPGAAPRRGWRWWGGLLLALVVWAVGFELAVHLQREGVPWLVSAAALLPGSYLIVRRVGQRR